MANASPLMRSRLLQAPASAAPLIPRRNQLTLWWKIPTTASISSLISGLEPVDAARMRLGHEQCHLLRFGASSLAPRSPPKPRPGLNLQYFPRRTFPKSHTGSREQAEPCILIAARLTPDEPTDSQVIRLNTGLAQ